GAGPSCTTSTRCGGTSTSCTRGNATMAMPGSSSSSSSRAAGPVAGDDARREAWPARGTGRPISRRHTLRPLRGTWATGLATRAMRRGRTTRRCRRTCAGRTARRSRRRSGSRSSRTLRRGRRTGGDLGSCCCCGTATCRICRRRDRTRS
ncbi:hypothetical protein E4U42_000994, partial [Claviceps africana]